MLKCLLQASAKLLAIDSPLASDVGTQPLVRRDVFFRRPICAGRERSAALAGGCYRFPESFQQSVTRN